VLQQRLTVPRGYADLRVGPNTAVALAVCVAYGLVGVVSTAVTMGSVLASSGETGHPGVGGWRSTVYLTVSLILLCAVAGGRARAANSVLGGAYLAAGVGLAWFRAGAPQLLALNHPENVAYLCTAAVLIGFGRTQD
jgi:hypothetical protein